MTNIFVTVLAKKHISIQPRNVQHPWGARLTHHCTSRNKPFILIPLIGFSGMAKARSSFLPCEVSFTGRFCGPDHAVTPSLEAQSCCYSMPLRDSQPCPTSEASYYFQQPRYRCFKYWPIPTSNPNICLLSYKPITNAAFSGYGAISTHATYGSQIHLLKGSDL